MEGGSEAEGEDGGGGLEKGEKIKEGWTEREREEGGKERKREGDVKEEK